MVRYLLGAAVVAHVARTGIADVVKSEIGTSRQGRPIVVYTIAEPGERTPDHRPALLVVAGVNPDHRIGVSAARSLIGRDWSDAGDLLSDYTLYVLPELNPDGSGWLSGSLCGARVELGRTVAPFDADRDRRLSEDGPNDLNGDGMITQMRVEHPPARYGWTPNLVADEEDERLMRAPRPEKGEAGRWVVLTEGLDDDGDGAFNEDGPGGAGSGVDLDRNFPTHWPEFSEGAGLVPLSEPESLALVRWMQAHRNIVGVLVLGPGDSLLNKPPLGQYDQTKRVPLGLERGDELYWSHVVERYKTHVSFDSAPAPNYEGSLLSWAYADFGAWAFESAVWSRPAIEAGRNESARADSPEAEPAPEDPPPADTRADERQALLDRGVPEEIATFITATLEERQQMASEFENASLEERQAMMAQVQRLPPDIQARVMAAVQETAGGQPAGAAAPDHGESTRPSGPRGKSKSDDGKWLAYSDASRNGEGFVEWTPVEHPQLGSVEVGGFVPGFRINPPAEDEQTCADAEAAFVTDLLGMLPRVSIVGAESERLTDGVWRVSVELRNTGLLPTSSTVGLKIGQPIAVEIAVDPEAVVSGRRVVSIDRLESGPKRIEWLIRGQTGQVVLCRVRSERFGEHTASVTLEGAMP
ncbi:MAG: hypothetical protein Kow0022_01600 [Phycisphaerales bacterium]